MSLCVSKMGSCCSCRAVKHMGKQLKVCSMYFSTAIVVTRMISSLLLCWFRKKLQVDSVSLKDQFPQSSWLRRQTPDNWEQTKSLLKVSRYADWRAAEINLNFWLFRIYMRVIWFKKFEIILCVVRGSFRGRFCKHNGFGLMATGRLTAVWIT